MGLTFKENVPDTRNSKVTDIIKYLKEIKISVNIVENLEIILIIYFIEDI